ncbi:calcium-binding protein [Prochlorococcus sp. MIT 1300]|uniref:calcium-binding protein n=1 Tax=Prochlorococcus sp. MIT 1300 TaxID=3096218 RepID=UPI002A763DC0|nr:calcium-binding protein [Prochlorococcus sp. MIT 1300]
MPQTIYLQKKGAIDQFAIDTNGGLVISQSFSHNGGAYRGDTLSSYDSSGKLNWELPFGANYPRTSYRDPTTVIEDIEIDQNNDIYIGGMFRRNAMGLWADDNDAFIAKVSSKGQLKWVKQIDSGDFDGDWVDIEIDKNGNIFAAFHIRGGKFEDLKQNIYHGNPHPKDYDSQILLVKYNSNGDRGWVNLIHSGWHTDLYDMTISKEGDLVIQGNVQPEIEQENGTWGLQTINGKPEKFFDFELYINNKKTNTQRIRKWAKEDYESNLTKLNLVISKDGLFKEGHFTDYAGTPWPWGQESIYNKNWRSAHSFNDKESGKYYTFNGKIYGNYRYPSFGTVNGFSDPGGDLYIQAAKYPDPINNEVSLSDLSWLTKNIKLDEPVVLEKKDKYSTNYKYEIRIEDDINGDMAYLYYPIDISSFDDGPTSLKPTIDYVRFGYIDKIEEKTSSSKYNFQESDKVSSIVDNWFSTSTAITSQSKDISDSQLAITTNTWDQTININRVSRAASSGGLIQAKQITFNQPVKSGSVIDGGNGVDTVRGLAGWDVLDSGAGDDLVHGGNGRDIITGGSGADELHGDFGWNTYRSEKDGAKDLIVIKSDQHLSNWIYGKAGNNPNGEKVDIMEGLDAFDEIKIVGVFTPDLSFAQATAKGVSGVGIYAKGALEGLYTGGDLSIAQIQGMTTGDPTAKWSYRTNATTPDLLA